MLSWSGSKSSLHAWNNHKLLNAETEIGNFKVVIERLEDEHLALT
jgi:hypothetical protein